jgi:predicted transcriptional regulator
MSYTRAMAATTTIKVPPALRDRVNREANTRGLTAAELLTELIDDYERRQRLDAFGRAFAAADEQYQAETETWNSAEAEWPRA